MLFIICALACEAQPLISHFKLQLTSASPFSIYKSSKNPSLALAVSGVGKVLTATAMGYLQAMIGEPHAAWLNIGIAGHRSLPLGTGMLAHQIIDEAGGQRYYPIFTVDRPVQTTSLLTVDRPATDFTEGFAYDMEGAAFWKAASRFTTAELIHCYKVISDNQDTSMIHLTKQTVQSLIAAQLIAIESFVDSLQGLSSSLAKLQLSSEEIEPFLRRWHFTASQKHQLKQSLQRWKACTSKSLQELWNSELLTFTKSEDVLICLNSFISKKMS